MDNNEQINTVPLTMVSQLDPNKMLEHIGHSLEIARYQDNDGETGGTIVNVSLECMDCGELLADADAMPEQELNQ